jgi:hypothetical protein
MRRWKKQVVALGISASLLTGGAFLPYANAADVGKASITAKIGEHPILKQKEEAKDQVFLSDDTFVVKYQQPFSYHEYKKLGVTVIQSIPELNYSIIKIKDKKNASRTIKRIQQHPKTLAIQPSALYKPMSFKDPKADLQYMHDLLKTESAQKLAGKHKVKIAVIDQGIDKNHPELKGKLLNSYNVINPMNQATPDYHGTHVAGIIAAEKGNDVGGYGINPNVELISIDVIDRSWTTTDYTIAQAILEAVKRGAKVINMSLGSPMPSPILEDAVKEALSKNVIIVASAGNSGDDTRMYPASIEGVISVGSINNEKKLSYFSTYGPSVDLVAPGEDVYSTLYDYEKKSTYYNMSGTSMSAPVVTGVVSLLLSKYPDLTPQEVEFILEHTAEDLGEKGFDVKYGYGLVNPIAALKYNIKNIPKYVKVELTNEELDKVAKKIDPSPNYQVKEYFTKPSKRHVYKLQVNEGDHIQITLNGAKQYDYKFNVYMDHDKDPFELQVNDVTEGKIEGKAIIAPFSGEMVIEVKDVNGNYDDSKTKKAWYELSVERVFELPEDDSSVEAPIHIDNVPFQTTKPLYFLGEEGDDDFFRFRVDSEKLIKIDLSKVPGLDTNISVYAAEQFGLMPEELLDEGFVKEAAIQISKDDVAPMYYANSKGASEGETLVFKADPGMEYLVKVSSKQNLYFGFIEFFFMGPVKEKEETILQSFIPYKLSIDSKDVPADEDMLPEAFDEYFIKEIEGETPLEMAKAKVAATLEDEEFDWETHYIETLQANAREYNIGGEIGGFIQAMWDEDWYKVTPETTGIYQFNVGNNLGEIPRVEVYKLVKPTEEERKENEEAKPYLQYMGENIMWGSYGIGFSDHVYVSMEKGEEYYIKIASDFFTNSIPFNGYRMTSKILDHHVYDSNEPNNQFNQAKTITHKKVTGALSSAYDEDLFYYEAKSNDVMGLLFKNEEPSKKLKDKLPPELFAPVYGFAVIVEDTNKNKRIDEEEWRKSHYIDRIYMDGTTFGSIKVTKGKNYFIILSGYVDGMYPFSLTPYSLHVQPVSTKDEDKGSVVKNNIPSKPLFFRKSTNHYYTTGYLNAGVPYGDEDWYRVYIPSNKGVKITLDGGPEIDGVIEVYQNGKLMNRADYYVAGDMEVLTLNLKKGTYDIKVRDVNGNSSLTPYKLKVYYQ